MALSESLARRLHPDVFAALAESTSRLKELEEEHTRLVGANEELTEKVADLEAKLGAATDDLRGVGVFMWQSSLMNAMDRLVLTLVHDAGGTMQAGALLRTIATTKVLIHGTLEKLFGYGFLSSFEEEIVLSSWGKRIMDLTADYRSMVGKPRPEVGGEAEVRAHEKDEAPATEEDKPSDEDTGPGKDKDPAIPGA